MIALLLWVSACAHSADLVGAATVTDGDTVEIGGTRIRLFGIDAPESGQLCGDATDRTYPCGGRAANTLDTLLRGKTVRCTPRDTDRYGRTVAVCYVAGTDVNALMVRSGWSLAYRQYSTDYVDEELAAKADRAGLWAGSFVAPWDYRHGERGTYVAPAPSRPEGCCRMCTSSQPCGDACIPSGSTCHSAPGCACAP